MTLIKSVAGDGFSVDLRAADPAATARQLQRQLRAIEPERGLVILYRPGQPSVCPACGAANWHVGRTNAECGQCGWACDLAPPERSSKDELLDHLEERL